MSRLRNWLRLGGRNEEGATAVEYGIIVALIAVVVIAGVTLLGEELNNLFTNVEGDIADAHEDGNAGEG